MPDFNYKAVNDTGKIIKGTISSNNSLEAEASLVKQGLSVLSVKEKSAVFNVLKRGPSYKDLILMCIQLEQLNKAGVPLLSSLIDVRDSTENQNFKKILTQICESVRSGDKLSEAFKAQGKYFDEFMIGLLQVGEETGNLSDIFGKLADHYKWSLDLSKKVKKAVRYPIVMLVLMGIIIGVMMVFVVPKLVEFLINMDIPLPGYTIALISTSKFVSSNILIIILVIVGTVFAIITSYKVSKPARYFWDRFLLFAPIFGPVVLKINLSRFCHFFSITFNSGMEVLSCVEAGKMVMTNVILRDAIDVAKDKIANGTSITNSLSEANLFPSLVLRMFKVGEDSGNIEQSLTNVTHFYNAEVNDSIEIMVGAIQPTLIVVVGGILAWIILAVFGPLYGNLATFLNKF